MVRRLAAVCIALTLAACSNTTDSDEPAVADGAEQEVVSSKASIVVEDYQAASGKAFGIASYNATIRRSNKGTYLVTKAVDEKGKALYSIVVSATGKAVMFNLRPVAGSG